MSLPPISADQARSFAAAAGFGGVALDTIVAIAEAESGLVPDARNTNSDSHTFPDGHVGPSTDRGILQINNYWWPQYSDAQCDGPATAFTIGWTISQAGTVFRDWSTYASGAYLTFMPQGTTPMALIRKLPNVDSLDFSEFWNDPNGGGVRVTGDCGESAMGAAMVCASPPIESNAQAQALMHALVDDMIARNIAAGYTSGNVGSTTMAHLRDELVVKSGAAAYDTNSFISFEQPLPADALHALLLKEAGVRPVILEVATAGAGLHAIDGSHAESGVAYHFICVLGLYDEGYLCYDGDNSNIWNALPIYPWSALEAATPCALMVVNLQEGIPATPMLQVADTLNFFHTISTDDSAWRCNPTGQPVQGSILVFYRSVGGGAAGAALNGLSLLGLPLSGELAPDSAYNGRVQVFERGAIAFDPQFKWDKPAGYSAANGNGSYIAHIDKGFVYDRITSALESQLAAAQAQVAGLTGQLANAKDVAQKAQSDLSAAQLQLANVQAQLASETTSANAALAAQAAAEAARDAAQASLADAQGKLDAALAQVAQLEADQSAGTQAIKALQMAQAALDAAAAANAASSAASSSTKASSSSAS